MFSRKKNINYSTGTYDYIKIPWYYNILMRKLDPSRKSYVKELLAECRWCRDLSTDNILYYADDDVPGDEYFNNYIKKLWKLHKNDKDYIDRKKDNEDHSKLREWLSGDNIDTIPNTSISAHSRNMANGVYTTVFFK